MSRVEQAPDCLVFDTDAKVTRAQAEAIRAVGISGFARYVGLDAEGAGDIDAAELEMLLSVFDGGFLVQHVLNPGWHPTGALGELHGTNAARNAAAVGYLAGAHVFLDDEGMAPSTFAASAIDYTEAAASAIRADGFAAGGYFGFGVPLSPEELYSLRGINSYWAAPRKLGTREVAVRGYALQQLWPTVTLSGCALDVNVLRTDRLGERPYWMTSR